jgi:hypothetical protein
MQCLTKIDTHSVYKILRKLSHKKKLNIITIIAQRKLKHYNIKNQ